MNKVTKKHLEYSEGVRYTKHLKHKAASGRYMKDRSRNNFDNLKTVSEDFYKYLKIHQSKVNRFYR